MKYKTERYERYNDNSLVKIIDIYIFIIPKVEPVYFVHGYGLYHKSISCSLMLGIIRIKVLLLQR